MEYSYICKNCGRKNDRVVYPSQPKPQYCPRRPTLAECRTGNWTVYKNCYREYLNRGKTIKMPVSDEKKVLSVKLSGKNVPFVETKQGISIDLP